MYMQKLHPPDLLENSVGINSWTLLWSDVFVCVCLASGSVGRKTGNEEAAAEEEEDREEVFAVELHKGPHGLGLALVDGTVSIHNHCL